VRIASDRARRSSIGRAVALGVLHGPAELLPISSSGHTALVPWLLRWRGDELDDELRKAFEVALHAGTAAALLIALRGEIAEAVDGLDTRRLTLEGQIEARLGTPRTIAAALLGGALLMAWADRWPQTRDHRQAGAGDALWLGLAQALALIPGVSRNGATLAAARFRRFTREDANRLSRHVALPVIAGATALKAIRLHRRGLPAGTAVPFAAGAMASFTSTLGSTWLIGQVERDCALLPYSLYRVGLAALIVRELRHEARSTGPGSPA
jgi:undecaprenyl-diphosphatase